MFDRKWTIKEYKNEQDKQTAKRLASDLKIPLFMSEILVKRGINNENDARAYFSPSDEHIHDPFLLPDMEVAVERILQAADKGEHITIFGDYDADGITSTAIMYHFLINHLEIDVDYYIPDRLSEGYGMSIDAVNVISSRGTNLIITVDCGVVSHNEIEYAKKLGIDVLVTDHHHCEEILPECCAVINPTRKDSLYPNRCLAGVGVAYKVIQAIAVSIGMEEDVKKYIPIVAVGTIGDSVPLIGENRVLASIGLNKISECEQIGLMKLIEVSGALSYNKKITAKTISYCVVPRINAAGRMGNAYRALQLLITDDEEEAKKIAETLSSENLKRQEFETVIITEAHKKENQFTKEDDFFVVAAGDDWHHGVTGIVASRISEFYNKPTIILSCDYKTNTARGSARSVEGFDLYAALSSCSDTLIKFGGHEMAAGLSVYIDKIPELVSKLNKYCLSLDKLPSSILQLEAESVINPEDITLKNAQLLELMEPLGMGNVSPLLFVSGFSVARINKVGDNGKHLKLYLESKKEDIEGFFDAVAFNGGKYASMLSGASEYSLMFRMEVNEWQGNKKVSMVLSDLCNTDYIIDKSSEIMYNYRTICSNNSFCINKEELSVLYKAIKTFYPEGLKFENLAKLMTEMVKRNVGITWFKMIKSLEVFYQLELLVFSDIKEDKYDSFINGNSVLVINKKQNKVDLSSSKIFRDTVG